MQTRSVLLVDDEEIVRRGLSRKVDWETLNLRLVATAAHGREALELITRQPIDIVVTDVLMPELDGIGLIQEAAAAAHSPKFIVLSGYNEFEFARRAMGLGVRHYVLKPTQVDELKKALREVAEQIETEERVHSQLKAAEQSDSMADPYARQGMLRRLLLPRRQRNDAFAALRERWDRETAGAASLVVVDLGTAAPGKREADVEVVAERTFTAGKLHGAVSTDSFVVLFVSGSSPEKLNEQVELLAGRLKAISGPKLQIAATPPGSASELAGRYEAAVSQLHCAFYSEQTVVSTEIEAVQMAEQLPEEVAAALAEAVNAVKSAAPESARAALEQALLLSRRAVLRPSVFKSHCVELLVQLGAGATTEIWDSVKRYVPAVQDAANSVELRTALGEAFELMVPEFTSLTASPQERMVRTLQSAVKSRFSESDLSLTKLTGSVVHGNVDYVGRVFRKVTGVRFTEYLIQIRMEQAKRFLRQYPQMPIREIARRVGYGTNAQYFSYSFHRYEGTTPSAFRTSATQ